MKPTLEDYEAELEILTHYGTFRLLVDMYLSEKKELVDFTEALYSEQLDYLMQLKEQLDEETE